jgi:hypothetical protein
MSPMSRVTPLRRVPDEAVLVRAAGPEDAAAVRRLAALDSTRVPAGRLLLAEVDGELRAALDLDFGTHVADPFVPSAHLLAMLHAQAEALRVVPGRQAGRAKHPSTPALRPA